MAETEVHKKKKSKNRVVLALVLGWCALIWLITMVRMAQGQELPVYMLELDPPPPVAASQPVDDRPYELGYFFFGQRADHQQDIDESLEDILARGRRHQDEMEQNPGRWWRGWLDRLLPDDYGPPER